MTFSVAAVVSSVVVVVVSSLVSTEVEAAVVATVIGTSSVVVSGWTVSGSVWDYLISELLTSVLISVCTVELTWQEATPNKTLVTAITVISFNVSLFLFMSFSLRSS